MRAAKPCACMCDCFRGRGPKNIVGGDNMDRPVEIELACASQLSANLFIHAAQVKPPAHFGKRVGVLVEHLN